MEISFKGSAVRHRISRRRSGHVVKTTSVIFRQPAPASSPLQDERIVFLGVDQTGALLEVMGVETEQGGLLIIHAMPIRKRYLNMLEGGI